MIHALVRVFFVIAAVIAVIGLVELAYYPLSIAFERRRRRTPPTPDWLPSVSVIVPAYNEERVVANCVDSILADAYERKQVVLVDDGSTDGTLAVLRRYEHRDNVSVIAQRNGGKAAALNTGIGQATGEVLFFVDADGIFTATTIANVLAGFTEPRVGGVCGNDEPSNLDRHQTRLLALLTHGTAFVRRALARVNFLTIVSGNIGAFRRSVIEEVGTFTEGFIGEDLELTWRVHRAGYRVNFCPNALVYAEVPSTLGALWKQRVRWTRGLAQTARTHKDMLFTGRNGPVGWYLPYNLVSMLLVPVVQLVAMVLLGFLLATGNSPVSLRAVTGLGLLGILLAVGAICFAIALDHAWRDLRYLYVLPAWPLFSIMMSAVVVWALALELRGAPRQWNKLARTGVVSRGNSKIPRRRFSVWSRPLCRASRPRAARSRARACLTTISSFDLG